MNTPTTVNMSQRPDRSAKVESRVPSELRTKLELIASVRQLDLSDIVREALRQYTTRFEQQAAA